mmetsp:Transcript_81210/g.143209  ORF Transcript_81210/g.143209 Transcript_81210/m.143209 type:complete len:129 (-) Transcript_81210:119-505(-)
MAPHFPEVRLPPNWFKKDAGQDITSALPKAQELGAFFSSYGGDEKTRPRNGTFYFNRANGGSTVFGPAYYNMFNFARIGKLGKYVLWMALPCILQRSWMKTRGIGIEYDVDLENVAPFEAKKNPAHGH